MLPFSINISLSNTDNYVGKESKRAIIISPPRPSPWVALHSDAL